MKLISSEDVKSTIGEAEAKGLFAMFRKTGRCIETKSTRLKRNGNFADMVFLDVDKAIEFMRDRLENHELRGRYSRFWEVRLSQLNKIKATA